MLTQDDLKQIALLLDEKLETKLEAKFEQKLAPIKKDIKKIKSDLKLVINTFDKKDISMTYRMERVERHVGLPEMSNRPMW